MRNLWVIIFLFLMTLIFSGVGYMTYHSVTKLASEGGTVSGTVVELVYSPSTGKNNSGVYYPVVEFRTEDGAVMREKAHTGSSPPSHKEGEKVEVIYNKDNPKDWCIKDFWDMYLLPVIFGFAGLCLFIATVVVTFVSFVGGGGRPMSIEKNFGSRKL